MPGKTTWLIFAFLVVIVSSYEATLTKTVFYLDPENTFTQPFFRTKNNIVGYNLECSTDSDSDSGTDSETETPQFFSINLQNSSAVPIFEDTMTACGQAKATYLRMFYHSNTSTLVYYCTGNNTLLILNEDDYTVTDIVPVTTAGEFKETKLTAEGTSVVILGIAGLYVSDTPSQLIKIDLETLQVVRQVTFDSNLEAGEVVTSYASTDLSSFVLTSLVDRAAGKLTVTLYNAVFASNSYTLTRLDSSSSKYTYDSEIRTSELFCFGPYVVTNDYYNILLYTAEGKLAYTFDNLEFNAQGSSGSTSPWISLPNYAMQKGSSSFYAFSNLGPVFKFTLNGQDVTKETLLHDGNIVSFVIGNQYGNDLVFSIDPVNIQYDTTFTIIDFETSEVIYRTPDFLNQMGYLDIADTVYITTEGGSDINGIASYDLKTNLLVGYLKEDYQDYIYEKIFKVFYFIVKPEATETNCTVKYYDPTTLETGTVFSYDEGTPCKNSYFQAINASDSKYSPNFVIQLNEVSSIVPQLQNSYLIHTQTYDRVTAKWPMSLGYAYVVPNFETLKMYYVRTGSKVPYKFSVNTYLFDEASNGFNLNKSYSLGEIDFSDDGDFVQLDPDTVAFAPGNSCMIINLAEGTSQEYSVPAPLTIVSIDTFKDVQGQTHLIVSTATSDLSASGPYYMLDLDGTLTVMPESNKYTVQASSGGESSFWMLDYYPGSIQVLRFYDSFSAESNANVIPQQSIFDILQ